MKIATAHLLFAAVALFAAPACKESKADAPSSSEEKAEKKSEKSEEKKEEVKKSASVKIASIKPTLENDFDGKGKYVKVAFEVTSTTKLEASKDLRVKMVCNVGDKKMSEKPSALINFAELGKGETKKSDVSAWVLDPLAKAPSSCTLTFFFGDILGDDDEKVAEVCFKPPSKVSDGACSE
jgi:hypothetical protein